MKFVLEDVVFTLVVADVDCKYDVVLRVLMADVANSSDVDAFEATAIPAADPSTCSC